VTLFLAIAAVSGWGVAIVASVSGVTAVMTLREVTRRIRETK
jgi:hypothetical protein